MSQRKELSYSKSTGVEAIERRLTALELEKRVQRLERQRHGAESGDTAAGKMPHNIVMLRDSGPSSEEINLGDYWKTIRRHKKTVLLLPLIATALTAIYAFTAHPLYKSTVSMEIEPGNQQPLSQKTVAAPAIDRKFFFNTQHDIIFSDNVATKVIKKLKLQQLEDFEAGTGPLAFLGAGPADHAVAGVEYGEDYVPRRLIKKFQKNMSFKREESSEIANLSYVAKDPQLSADVANAISEAYIDVGLETQLDETRQAKRWLRDNLDSLREKLARSEEKLRAYKDKEGLVDSESFAAQTTGKLGNLTTELVKAKAKRAQAEVLYNQVKTAEKRGRGYGSLAAVLNNTLIQALKQEQSRLQRKVSELSGRYLDKHPKMVAAKADLREATSRVNVEIAKVVDGIKKDYQAALAQEKEIKRFINEQKNEMRAFSGKSSVLSKLEREVQANKELYDTFLKRLKETDVSGFNSKTRVHIIDRAVPPERAFKPKKAQLLSAALLLGLFAGIALAFLKEHLDNTFNLPEDLEDRLKLPVLGMLPKLRGKHRKEPERYYLTDTRSSFAEAVNGIRTGILFSDIDNPPKAVLVTSAVPNEGKTTTASNLALSFSQLGRTLLIDADMRKPSLGKAMGGANAHAGLSDLISGQKKFHECLLRDKEVENLYFMPSGTIPPNPLEILQSRRFEQAFDFLRKYFTHIVVDCPPVLPVSDPLIAGQLVDCVIFVAKAGDTPDTAAQEALKRLRSAQLEPFGAVLTMVDVEKLKGHAGYEYYGSEYRYGAV